MQQEIIHSICKGYNKVKVFSSESAWATAGDIAKHIAVSRSTVYRYMPELVRLGFFEYRSWYTFSKKMTSYRMTAKGDLYLKSWKELGFDVK